MPGSTPIRARARVVLPQPEFADEAEHRAGLGTREVDAVDRMDRGRRQAVGDGEILDGEQLGHQLSLQLREEQLLIAAADEEAGEHHEDDAEARRHEPGKLAARSSACDA